MLALLKQYLNLAKPGIVFGNLISVTGGFFLASRGDADLTLFLATALGVALVIASGCVFNNYIDRDIDQKMERTRNRVLAQGLVSPAHAIVYACVLGVAGVAVLYAASNTLAVMLVLMGFVVYVGLYSLWLKRGSVYGTLVGSLSGAAPPVVGYCAVSNEFDAGAAILLLIFSLWQMPHSYAIAIFRFNDYQAANIPVLPVIKGISAAKRQIVLYIAAFVVATLMLTLSGYAGYSYFVVAALSGAYWLWMGVSGYKAVDDTVWARKLFTFSIVTITMLSVMMSVDFISAPEQVLVTSINHLCSQFAASAQGICAVVAGI
ncbi:MULTISPECIES: heme o synthase [Pseudomonas]|jgi:protoheme IX farnesyltransferase|uniref:Protoheme IX farnesyltransferase n=1 Tax=Ectopseudomonas oleovorans TaxID=301 RepID=A0A653B982_ECTOL|nr:MULTISPECIES: heme o synthase [Pseudomonas]CAE6908978.1 heme O synthase [Pseudomonas oleovorans]QFT21448.1 Protoheme IX farnesyltransferase [Pseudomonas sp. THAF187a]QFT41636.1 Protoheme IX farnesyltransferase [Pseudomonas sp. THAF42]QTS88068.1 protoheme IX farnesyltransferase [Pseudomonas khazarica]WFC61841.1 protoheme IX farnesyltransferase [Pseudomonas sp. REST10]|tara:strand:+ start:29778 stop:30734 length:957 start_codon:yes stop_codon:yes gene_type:complete